MYQEIITINPQSIISFGNQVSSILLGKSVSVSDYLGAKGESLKIGNKIFKVYPVHYPVGQGRRNMPLAIKRIKKIIYKKYCKELEKVLIFPSVLTISKI